MVEDICFPGFEEMLLFFYIQIPEQEAPITSVSIDPMGTMMAAVNNKVCQ